MGSNLKYQKWRFQGLEILDPFSRSHTLIHLTFHSGWALRKSSIRSIDFRKIDSIDQVETLFDFVKFRSIGEFCVRDANDGLLHGFQPSEGVRCSVREPWGSEQKTFCSDPPGSLTERCYPAPTLTNSFLVNMGCLSCEHGGKMS